MTVVDWDSDLDVDRPDGGIEGFDQVYGAAFAPEAKLVHLVDGGSNPGHSASCCWMSEVGS